MNLAGMGKYVIFQKALLAKQNQRSEEEVTQD